MKSMWLRGQCWSLAVLILGLSACTTSQPVVHASAQPSVKPSAPVVTDPQRCTRLARRGFTPCPPTPDKLTLPATRIVNATNGAISDATALQWGQALRVAQGYYYWAMQNGARDALTSGVLSDPSPSALANLLGPDLREIDAAKEAGGVLIFRPLKMPSANVVAIPQTLQGSMQRQHLMPSSYGMAIHFAGPSSSAIQMPDGSVKLLGSSAAEYVVNVIVWGEFRDDQDIGPIWYEYGFYGCDAEVRDVCKL
jgi:hypothetical protein